MLRPNSFSKTSRISSKGVAGALSHNVTSLLTHAAGAKSGFPTIWATYIKPRLEYILFHRDLHHCSRKKICSLETPKNNRTNIKLDIKEKGKRNKKITKHRILMQLRFENRKTTRTVYLMHSNKILKFTR